MAALLHLAFCFCGSLRLVAPFPRASSLASRQHVRAIATHLVKIKVNALSCFARSMVVAASQPRASHPDLQQSLPAQTRRLAP